MHDSGPKEHTFPYCSGYLQAVDRGRARWYYRFHTFDTSVVRPSMSNFQQRTYLILRSFLAKSTNGPLLSPCIGHEHIAFACVSHLIQILGFVQPEIEREKKIEAVGLGCLGLQRYASRHWISHILNYLNEVDHPEFSSGVPLIAQLLHLTTAHDILLQTVRPRIYEDDQVMAPTPELQKLKTFPEICDLITRVLSFQDSFSAKQLAEGPSMQLKPSTFVIDRCELTGFQ